MSRRSQPQSQVDEAAFPVRLRVIVLEYGFGPQLLEIHRWLDRNIGRGNFAHHGGGRAVTRQGIAEDTTLFYFRTPQAAAAFVEATGVALCDGTEAESYRSPALPAGRR